MSFSVLVCGTFATFALVLNIILLLGGPGFLLYFLHRGLQARCAGPAGRMALHFLAFLIVGTFETAVCTLGSSNMVQ